jgi:hypothetical protein
LDPTKPAAELVISKTEIDLDGPDRPRPSNTRGRGSEPWSAVIGKDDDTAYVITRSDGQVVRIVDLHGKPKADASVDIGSEPTSIVIAPSGLRLFIADWAEGSIDVVTTPDFVVRPDADSRPQLDLNGALADTGFLGTVQARPGLAHPRALALTDNGDNNDDDETLYATEFFSQPLPTTPPPQSDAGAPTGPDPAGFDTNRQGVVYRIPLADGSVNPITLAPVEDTGFADSNGATTGCFPNQLYAAAVNGDRLYVTSLCASPKGPLGAIKQTDGSTNTDNFKTLLHPVLFAVDTTSNLEVPAERRVLTKEIEGVNAATPNAVPRMPLIPDDLLFARPKTGATREAFVTAMGGDAVFRLGDPGTIGFIDVAPQDQADGHLPIGTAVLESASVALVLNDNSQNLSVVDLGSNAVQKVESSIEATAHAMTTGDSPENQGHLLFATGAQEWSFKGQAWGSCEGCHPDGLSDGVTWFFARGPRRTLSTAGTYDSAGNRRVLLWTGNVDEIHDVEGIVRTVTGGVGAMLWSYTSKASTNNDRIVYDGSAVPPGEPTSTLRNNLNGSIKALLDDTNRLCKPDSTVCDRTPNLEWDQIDAFIRSVRAPNRPTTLKTAQVARGATLFRDGRCAACHGGPSWTISRVFYDPGVDYNGALPYAAPAPNPDGSFPELDIGRLRKESYAVPHELQQLNPVSLPDGFATFRSWNPAGKTPVVYLYGTQDKDGYDSKKTHANDQINCVLRAVGTFPKQSPPAVNAQGVVATGAPPVLEVRAADMATLALGATGFNVPSLLGLGTAASYFHAGNARTLEEAFSETFATHLRALKSDFLSDQTSRDADVADLITYLLSIDDSTTPEPVPGTSDLGFDPDLCAQPGVVRAAPPPAQVCSPGTRQCDGDKAVKVCDSTGTWSSTTCNNGATCTSCSGTADCAPFPAPVNMADIDTAGYNDQDLKLSQDELTAFFVSDRPTTSGPSGWTIWTASRTDRTAPLGPATPLPTTNLSNGIFSLSLEGDLLTLYFEGTQPGGINGLFMATRNGLSDPFGAPKLLFNDAGDPWISRDTTHLYYDSGGNIFVANRMGPAFFGSVSVMPNASSPVVSPDELTMYLAQDGNTGTRTDIAIARRASTADPFGTPPLPVLGVNTNDDDWPDWISDDGCRLYLHRFAPGVTSDVYLSEKK